MLGAASPSSQAVWKIYNLLVARFNDEYTVLIDVPRNALAEVVDSPIADAVVRVRTGSVHVVPGYDGVYGKLDLGVGDSAEKTRNGSVRQLNLADFW